MRTKLETIIKLCYLIAVWLTVPFLTEAYMWPWEAESFLIFLALFFFN